MLQLLGRIDDRARNDEWDKLVPTDRFAEKAQFIGAKRNDGVRTDHGN